MLFLKGEDELTVEIKLYGSKYFSIPVIENEAKRLAYELNGIESIPANNSPNLSGLLIVSSIIDEEVKENIIETTGITVWDRSNLFELTEKSPILKSELESILLQKSLSENDAFEGIDTSIKSNIDSLITIKPKRVKPKVEIKTELTEELKNITPGQEECREFEVKCVEALKYLFQEHLTVWKEQNKTDDDLHRFDLICRIASNHDFWKSLNTYFNSRDILFEFKNYSEKIQQGEIYSTEKYLFKKALRSVAIIIARNGASNNAIKAAKGILKESGKLIIILSLDDLIKMINLKEENDDPNAFLAELMDRTLLELSK